MFNVEEIHTLITSLILGIFIGILLGCLKCFGVETPNPYKSMGNSTSQEIKIKKQMFNACVSSGENRAKCYRIYYGN